MPNEGEGYCERCQTWRSSITCTECGLTTIPAQVETRLMRVASKLDAEMLIIVRRVRADAHYPARSFIGEIYNALLETYRLGTEGRSKRLGTESRLNARKR